jgi:hypothetical protein
MVLVGQAQRLSVPLTRRQRRAMSAAGAAAVLALIVAIVLIATQPSGVAASRHGCLNMVLASATGAGLLHECGAPARAFCRQEYARHDAVATAVQAQCRLAGIGRRRA